MAQLRPQTRSEVFNVLVMIYKSPTFCVQCLLQYALKVLFIRWQGFCPYYDLPLSPALLHYSIFMLSILLF